MASTQSKSAKASATRSDGESARWIFGLLLLFAGIFLVASVVFYYFDWRGDYSALHGIGSENPNFDDSIDNPCGRLGAWTAEMLVGRSFGLFGIVVPIIVTMMGARILRRRPVLFHHSVLSSLLVLILGSLTLGVAFDDGWGMFNSGWGGACGIEMGRLLSGSIGMVGCFIVLLGGWILTGVFINRNFINTVNRAGNVLVDKSGKLVGTVAQKVPSLQSLVVSRPREEEDDPFVVHPVGVAPVSGGVQTVNDYYARNRVTDDDPFEEHTLGAEEPEGADAAPLPSRLAGEEDEFVEIDLSDGTDDTGGAVPADTPAGAEDADAEENPFLDDDEPFTVKDAGAPAAAGDAPEGVVVTVEEHHDALLDEHRITTEAYDPLKDLVNYRRPSVALLEDYLSDSEVTDEEIYENKSRIEETLKNFGIPIQRIKATTGPTVTLYEIVQAQGVKISRIQNLQNDIAQSLKALGIRIIAPIPGKGTIGIEVPNRNKQIVSMYSAVRSMKFQEAKAELPVVKMMCSD